MKRTSLSLAALLLLSSPVAMANTVTSDACAAGVRDFSVTAVSVVGCLAVGTGNINGNNAEDAAFLASGWVFVDGSDSSDGAHNNWLTGTFSGTSGTFGINPMAYTTYDRVAIGFKSGDGNIAPTWAIFELADNTLSGTWSLSGQQGMSHGILYGWGTPDGGGPGTGVPEPGILALMGLGALGFMRARRQIKR